MNYHELAPRGRHDIWMDGKFALLKVAFLKHGFGKQLVEPLSRDSSRNASVSADFIVP